MALNRNRKFYIHLGRWLYALSGVSLSPSGDELGRIQKCYIWISFLSSALACVLAVICFSESLHSNYHRLLTFNLVMYFTGNFVTMILFHLSRENMSKLFQSCINLSHSVVLSFSQSHRILNPVWAVFYVFLSLYDNAQQEIILHIVRRKSGINPSAAVIFTMHAFLWPINFIYWAVNYNINTKECALM